MGARFLGRWIVANAVGELLGLGGGAVLAFVAVTRLEELLGAVPAAVLSALVFGVLEGTVVGGAQHHAMRPLPRRPDRRSWVAATVAGGTVAWLAVSIPFALLASGGDGSSVAAVEEPPLVAQLAVMAAVGVPAGAVLGVPQALALRRHVDRPGRWVAANAVAWAVGLPVVQLVAGGLPTSAPVVVALTLVAVGLLGAGAVVGVIHGPTLRRMLTEAPMEATPPRPFANVVTMWWIRAAPAHLRPRRLSVVEYDSSAGRHVALPVVAVPRAADGSRVVAVGRHEGKRWWRRFREAAPATLTDRDGTRSAVGSLEHGAARTRALAIYLADRPRASGRLRDDTPVVVFRPATSAPPATPAAVVAASSDGGRGPIRA